MGIASICFGQEDSTNIDLNPDEEPEMLQIKFKPRIGLGVGMMTFYGDVSNNHVGFHPTVSRVGYDLSVQNELTDWLDLKFYMMWGTVGSNERSLERNVNFQSDITTGGFIFNYNFQNFLKRDRILNPFIGVGIESVEFLSKTDLKDANGNYYHYWDDGTIRTLPQDDPFASTAQQIYRDYSYETDLRELNTDGLGDYTERTFAIPIQVGANLHLGERVKFRVGSSLHLTFTDNIDNVSGVSTGQAAGTPGKDKFLYTSFALTYDLKIDKDKKFDDEDGIEFGPEDCFADEFDEDSDGVADHCDECHKTLAEHAPVDSVGCPLDSDNDLVPDYMDKEIDSPEGSIVDEDGIALDDEDFLKRYNQYMDSTGAYNDFEADTLAPIQGTIREKKPKDPETGDPENPDGPDTEDKLKEGQHLVVIGGDTLTIDPEKYAELLSWPGLQEIEINGQKALVVKADDKEEAQKILNKMIELGIIKPEDGKIVKVEEDPDNPGSFVFKEVPLDDNITTVAEFPEGTVFRVQLGAYRNKLSKNVYGNVNDLVVIPGTDGLTRYYTGAFDSPQDAVGLKIKMLEDGFDGAFIVAYKDGKRMLLGKSGLTMADPTVPENITPLTEESSNPVNPEFVKFRVQVGAFKEDIPTEILDLYLKVGSVVPKFDAEEGLTKYFIGMYDSYDEANAKKDQLKAQGLIDAFTVGDLSGRIITAQEAIKFKGGN